MFSGTINIKIFSDIEDVSSVTTSVDQLELKNFQISCTVSKTFHIEADDIVILQIKSIESKHLNNVLINRENIKNKILIVILNNNALLVSSLAKLGFPELFIFPYELYKFVSYLTDIILNNSFRTSEVSAQKFKKNEQLFESIIGRSREFRRLVELAKRVSGKKNINILITGETGTGKGIFARAIHNYSNNRDIPFIDIVCTSIPESLLESELFGYEPGAFTNAIGRKLGLFELAEEGTLFLDEIGDISLNTQAKLLRTIEKKVLRRLGGVTDIPISARIISATNKNLEKLIENGSFRRDLYHRLDVVSINLPPLRYRDDDKILLAQHFLNEFNAQFGKSIKRIEKNAKDFIIKYPWPGNIRELRNAIERAVLLTEERVIRLRDFSHILTKQNVVPIKQKDNSVPLLPQFVRLDINYTITNLIKINKLYAKEVLTKMEGNKSKTANILGISRPKLDKLLKNIS